MAKVVLMTKFDFKKTADYTATSKFQVLVPEPSNFLMIDGEGDPNTADAYKNALQTLYPVAYKMKFSSQLSGHDYVVPPLEGLWWAENLSSFTRNRNKSEWQWTMMLRVPGWLGEEDFQSSLTAAMKGAELPSSQALRLDRLEEGACVQVLHTGPYDAEGPVIEGLHEFAANQGWKLAGVHHEIYLSDPRRSSPDKLKTILRQPIMKQE